MTETGSLDPRPPRPKRLTALRSVRVRIVGWMLLLVGLTFVATTAAELVITTAWLREEVDAELAHQVSEFRSFAVEYPATGGRANVRDVLEAAPRTRVVHEHQVFLSFIDGRPLHPVSGPVADLVDDPAFIARLATAEHPAYGDAATSAGHIRYAAVPVLAPPDPTPGAFVIATFPDRREEAIAAGFRTHAALGTGALTLAAVVGWLVSGHLVSPLRLLRETATSITQSDLTRRIPAHGHDEISDLTTTFNGMLDRLEQSFATQRQLIDDVGHELRTPITIVRGQLEVLGDDPRHRQRTIAVVTDELDRMNRMVGELLTLAKSQRPDFLRPEPVELSELVDDVFVKACALASRRWLLEAPARTGLLFGDRQRLTQALIQLADNAVQHTPQESRIWIGGEIHGGTARMWVRDDGPGIPPEQQDRIFERFARVTPSRNPHGSGLGLPIVKAIAEAHSGEVRLCSRSGLGSTFTLELPVANARPGASAST